MPRLTFLICTHDRADLLAKALVSLSAATRPPDWEVDILVAASACGDDTHALLVEYRHQFVGRAICRRPGSQSQRQESRMR